MRRLALTAGLVVALVLSFCPGRVEAASLTTGATGTYVATVDAQPAGKGDVRVRWTLALDGADPTRIVTVEVSLDSAPFTALTTRPATRSGAYVHKNVYGRYAKYRVQVRESGAVVSNGLETATVDTFPEYPDDVAPCPAGSGSAVLGRINAERTRIGHGEVREDPRLMRATLERAIRAAKTGNATHAGFTAVAKAHGYPATTKYGWAMGENLAWSSTDPGTVYNGWYGSSGHRANMLNPVYIEGGVGCAISTRHNGLAVWYGIFGVYG